MKQKNIIEVTTYLAIALIVLFLLIMFNKNIYHNNKTVIILHGYGSSANATQKLAQEISKTTSVRRRVIVNISKDKKIRTSIAYNPTIYQMNFTNKTTTEEQEVVVLEQLLRELKQKGVNAVTLVGHSMGANVALHAALNTNDGKVSSKYPKVEKLVSIAAPFNSGITKTGFDSKFNKNSINKKTHLPMYMDKNFNFFYKHRQYMDPNMKILNVIGNKSNDSDGVVTNFSSQSLQFIINKNQDYNVLTVRGNKVQHSQLRNNDMVVTQIAQFIR